MTLRVGVLGWGAIGSAVGEALIDGRVAGAVLAVVGHRRPIEVEGVPVVEPEDLAPLCDVVVEAAGHEAVRCHVPGLLSAGRRVLLVSTGALRDAELLADLRSSGGDRLTVSSGAIGGIDLVQACRLGGEIQRIHLTTTKPPRSLCQRWMDPEMLEGLERAEKTIVCFDGGALEATERFPSNVNVAATLAIAVGDWDRVFVTVVAEPATSMNRHHIVIESDIGRYEIDVCNTPLSGNPRSSAMVVASVLRGIDSFVPRSSRRPGPVVI